MRAKRWEAGKEEENKGTDRIDPSVVEANRSALKATMEPYELNDQKERRRRAEGEG